MRHFNWRAAALVALTSLAVAACAVAREPSSSGQSKSGSSQSSTSSSSSQEQSQASDGNTKSSNAQRDNAQGSRKSDRDDRSSTNSASDRNTSANSRDRDERDSARSDRDDRASNRDRSSRDGDRNADNRANSGRDRDSSRENSSRRGNMRGPDIGIWFNRSSRDGLVISDVSSQGAIAKLGFREGDRIVSVNGRRVTREDEFIDFLLHGNARRVTVIVLRDNREETIYVEPALLVDDREYTEVDPLERFGIIVDDRYDDRIVVWRVIPRSPAYYAGFRPGDVIVTFGDRPYRTRTEFERGSRDWKAGDVNVQVRRGDRTRDLSVEIPNMDRSDRRSERTERRDERTAQRDSVTPDQGNANQSDRNSNDQRDNNRRGGILNGVGRGRGNR